MTVQDIDRGWKRIKAAVAGMKGAAARVGIQAGTPAGGDEGAGLSMAEVGFWNEFGTTDGRVPERSFLRSAIDENRDAYGVLGQRLVGGILDGRMHLRQALAILGQKAESDIKKKITRGPFAPNAPLTIARKGSSKPLIDTGAMRNSIRYVVEGA